ncbi:MAG: glycine zipper 2TM domain-containing protein [Pseudomonadota bacterium]
MLSIRLTVRAMTGIALVVSAPVFAGDHAGAPYESPDGNTIQTAKSNWSPAGSTSVQTAEKVFVDEHGVETVVRTRYIQRSHAATKPDIAGSSHARGVTTYPGHHFPVTPRPVVFERDQWLQECRRRTDGTDGDDKGGIIGGLLGAIAGGIIGNRVDDGERLAGTLIGAGAGGLAGLAIGTLIDSVGDDDDDYDCEEALDAYIAQYGQPGAHRFVGTHHGGYGYQGGYAHSSYAGHYGYGHCGCAPQQVAMVPVYYEQRQRVVVRETIEEEVTRERIIERHPTKLIKTAPRPTKVVPAPRQTKTKVRYTKD